MASGYTMNPTKAREGTVKMAPTKKSKELPAGKFKVEAGGSGKMQSFKGVGEQQPGVSAVTAKNAGKKWPTGLGGPSGKMQKFSGVKKQKSGRSSQG
jgi:hypothetical protein